ncbi:MAG: transporter substrate-binding domain-containing protein, partial [Alphaproteobacteria bacterium]|nr:transporter substrate-binding domain-containing protein [Alphaproteobacteria bacterium]
VVQAVLQRLDMEVPISFYPWARAYQLAQQRQNTIIYSIVRMEERENLFEWVGEVTRHNASFYKLKHNTGISTISALEDAKPYKVGVYLNDAIHMYLVRNGFTNLDVATDSRLNLKKLLSGRIDLIAMDDAAFSFQMQREDVQIDAFDRMLSIEEMSGSLYMAFSKGSDPALISKFKRALEEIKAEGLYYQIQRKYFPLG